jgi:hypothetical protein
LLLPALALGVRIPFGMGWVRDEVIGRRQIQVNPFGFVLSVGVESIPINDFPTMVDRSESLIEYSGQRINGVVPAQVLKLASSHCSAYRRRQQAVVESEKAIFAEVPIRQLENFISAEPYVPAPDGCYVRGRPPHILSLEYEFIRVCGLDAYNYPGTLGINDGLSVTQSYFSRDLSGFSLLADFSQGVYCSTSTAYSDNYKGSSGPSRKPCILESSVFDIENMLSFGVGLSALAFSLLMAFCVNYKRKLLSAALIGIPALIAASCPVWMYYAGFVFPYSFGLPPNWIPDRWHQCQYTENQRLPHLENVSQKLLTRRWFSYYDNYMANVLPIDKQIAAISSLCEGSSIRSIERMTGIHRDTIMRLGVRVGQGCTRLMDAKMRNL